MHHTLLIIGAGAAGLMAAVTAKELGIDTAILEGNDRVGKKILVTGDGRCNITNTSTAASEDGTAALSGRFHGKMPGFPLQVLEQFGVRQTIDFFYSLGLPLTELKEGMMYPRSLQAASVTELFQLALEEREVPVYFQHKVVDVTVGGGHPRFTVVCRTETEEQAVYTSDYLLLSTGGLTAPHTGADGSGYTLAEGLGHTLIQPVPSIVQLKVQYPHLKALSGIKLQGRAHILVNGEIVRSESGEIQFTDYGLAGPPILQLSREASVHLAKGDSVSVAVDLMPGRTEEEVVDFLDMHWGIFGHRTVADSFIGILHKKLTPVLLKEAGIDKQPYLLCQDLSWRAKAVFYRILKHWEFKVTDTNGFAHAQTTAGGVNTAEIMEGTLESRLVPGFYFAGEIVDVDGDFGGYNLQWAWSSGYVAAKALAESMKQKDVSG
ncbi:NAD(P)/FAD-dependent oxidoreductase [Paenibacillus sp. YN15]|uniref:NAD(P)/FAD-dependent oxidoreductase n=1 Tax=Paenibacillus sp. YN15 TaxID=1742774 RepID=UPI000DCBA836|nr:NAD(P)/FAD-dependent oxidoreductase [Paenibacillus sp. YN15]RAV02675.1 aminoacetone oxidase family FAD-binding enzyme [Paenibacillus sp. YN15]